MKAICILYALFIFSVAACGKSPNNDSTEPASEQKQTDKSDKPEKSSPKPANQTPEEYEDKWLSIEAIDTGWKANGKACNSKKLEMLMNEWSKKVDSATGLSGPNRDDISQNPVVFRAKAGVPATKMYKFLTKMVGSRMYKCRAQLVLDDGSVLRRWVYLPIDEGPSMEEDAGIRTWMQVGAEGDTIKYAFDADGEGWKPMKDGIVKSDRRYVLTEYNKLKEVLIAGLQAHDRETGREVTELEFHFTRDIGDEYPSWGFLFIAIDAIQQAKPKWTMHFKFMGDLSDDD